MKTAAVTGPEPQPVPAAAPEEADAERRRAPRFPTHIGASIGLERRQGEMRCYILNVSDTGALLLPADVLMCPSQFTLKPELGESRKCEVVWTNGKLLAVRFIGETAPLLTGIEWAALGGEPSFNLVGALSG
jgi:hypothetical protein